MRNLDQPSLVKLIKVYSSFDNLEGAGEIVNKKKDRFDLKDHAFLEQAFMLMYMFRLNCFLLFCFVLYILKCI